MIHYINKSTEEMKERQKVGLLEYAYGKVIEESKRSDKDKY